MLYRFGSLLVDGDTRTAYRDGARLPLTDKEFDVLHVLVQTPGILVENDPLIRIVWGDAHVSKDNLRRHIHALRRKVGEQHFVNVHNRGYYFAVSADTPETPPAPVPAPAVTEAQPTRGRPVRTVFGATLVMLLAGLAAWRFWPSEVQLLAVRQLTRDGRPKHGIIVSDGSNLYFNEIIGGRQVLASAPAVGGTVSLLNLAAGWPEPLDVSLARHALLIQDAGRLYEMPLGTTTLRPLQAAVPGHHLSASWDPAGRTLAVSGIRYAAIFEPGQPQSLLRMELPGFARLAGWSPDGSRLRIEELNAKAGTTQWWEWRRGERTVHPIPRFSPQPDEHPGGWLDDRFFVFRGGRDDPIGDPQIWLADESTGAPPRAYRLTLDSLIWRDPIGLPGSHTIVAAAGQSTGELVAIPLASDLPGFRQILPGVPAYELDYSRDGQWIAYTLFPEHSIWRCRVNGTDALRLTAPGIEAHQPHWSPDGTRIAFMGKPSSAGSHTHIYLVPAAGGPLDEVLPQGDDQGVPTWSPDGRTIVFGDLRVPAGFERASIHQLFLPTRTVSTIPASVGMWTPRLSPDGKHLAAVKHDNSSLYIRDNARGVWRKCATRGMVDEPMWAADSAWLQFAIRDGQQVLITRVNPDCSGPKQIVDIAAYDLVGATWFGIAPDRSPMVLLHVPDEIYALDWRLRRKFPEFRPGSN